MDYNPRMSTAPRVSTMNNHRSRAQEEDSFMTLVRNTFHRHAHPS